MSTRTSRDSEAVLYYTPFTSTNGFLTPELCSWKCKLVDHWEDYEHSSAKFYVKNRLDGFVPVQED